MYKKTVLNNGLRIVTCRMPGRQSVALGLWIRVGGRDESKKNKGIAHFLEHLVFKGTAKFSCRQIKESIEGRGGSLNGFTLEELSCYVVKLPSRYLDLALDILSDMALEPTLAAEDVEKEKKVICEEIKMYKDLPQHYVHELLDELLWPNQPLGMNISGDIASVSRITREDLFNFRNNCYTPRNIVVSAAGLLEHTELLEKVKKIFSGLKATRRNVFVQAREEQKKPKLKILAKDTEQTHLALGFHSLKREHALKHALALLHIILGANMSSRLFHEIREKRGLAYEIGTQVRRFLDTGSFSVHAGIDNRKVAETLKLILAELAKIKREPVSSDEFRRAKEFYLGQLILSLEDTLDQMFWLGESLISVDKIYTLKEVLRQVQRLRREDLLSVSRKIFKAENLNLAIIGPLRKREKEIFSCLYLN